MKKLIKLLLWIVVFASVNVSFSATEYTCLNDCEHNGYMYSYCESRCSYNEDNEVSSSKNIDYKCQNDCMQKGYMYSFCRSQCSY